MPVKITDLTAYTAPSNPDVIPIVDTGTGVTKKIQAGNLINAYLPIGMITPYAGTSAPSGWLICDGSAISRTTYANLFTLVGTTYGSGDGSTTFNLPDLRNRIATGKGSETEFNTLGKTGGAKTHTLSSNEMPTHTHIQNAHSHGVSDPGHAHSFAGGGGYGAGGYDPSRFRADGNSPAGSWSFVINPASTGIGIGSTTAVNQNTGGGQPHNNLQPYITLNYIVKV